MKCARSIGGECLANSVQIRPGVGVGVIKRQRQKLMQYQHVCAEPPKADIG
jgi:hypothetical protein